MLPSSAAAMFPLQKHRNSNQISPDLPCRFMPRTRTRRPRYSLRADHGRGLARMCFVASRFSTSVFGKTDTSCLCPMNAPVSSTGFASPSGIECRASACVCIHDWVALYCETLQPRRVNRVAQAWMLDLVGAKADCDDD